MLNFGKTGSGFALAAGPANIVQSFEEGDHHAVDSKVYDDGDEDQPLYSGYMSHIWDDRKVETKDRDFVEQKVILDDGIEDKCTPFT